MKHAQVLDRVRAVVESGDGREAKARRVADLIRRSGGYRWVGIYDANRHEIAVIAWSGLGAPAYPRFPADQGLSGSAVSSRSAVIANDVTKDPRYLTAFGTTRSQIIVPVLDSSTAAVVGTIDVESERINAFQDEDRAFLEQCASALAPLFIRGNAA